MEYRVLERTRPRVRSQSTREGACAPSPIDRRKHRAILLVMLHSLRIRDFAIIDFLELELARGMCVFTGETGAGKSIIIDALGLILGGRAHSDYVRTGAEAARIEALFDVESVPHVTEQLVSRDIREGDELVIRRSVSLRGPNRVDVNGRMFPLGALEEITAGLVDIYGQHEHHSLLRPETHLQMLDKYGALTDLHARYQVSWRSVRETEKRIEDASRSAAERAARLDYLKFVINEIDGAQPVPGELDKLKQERDMLRNARMLLESATEAYETLYGADEAISSKLAALVDRLRRAGAHDPRIEPAAETIETSRFALEEAAGELRDYAAKVNENPARLEEIEDRLELLGKLSKKYGGSVEAVVEHRAKCADEMVRIEEGEMSLDDLKRKLDEALDAARKHAAQLSAGRRRAAEGLRKAVERELKDLGMAGTSFEVRFSPVPEHDGLGPDGAETSEFYISPNVGEEPKPLVKIASGGELSRIMLALKTILVGTGDVPTLIFDEVDSGIGGGAAEVVGRKMRSLSQRAQVLCVTHLAQIAAFAQSHYLVSKTRQKGRTVTRVKRLDEKERIEELARMLGGVEVTDATRALAKEMLRSAKE